MMFMKRLLVAENYYWSFETNQAIAQTNETYAILATMSEIASLPGQVYTSMNAAISNKDTMWLVHKKTSGNSHLVEYWNPNSGDDARYRMVSTTDRTEAGWESLANDRVAKLVPNQPREIYAYEAPDTQEDRPLALRINQRANSNLDQITPAVSADPVKSTFAVVWKTSDGNDIKLRWYNQMGLAEGGESTVNGIFAPDVRSPAITHSPNGDTVLVVWSEKPEGSSVFSRIKARKMWWWPQHLTWLGQGEWTVNTTINDDVDLPAVAMQADGGYAIVWQRYNPVTSKNEIRWSAHSPVSSVTDQRFDSGTLNKYHPDITTVENNARYAVAFSGDGLGLMGSVFTRTVMNNQLQLGTQTSIGQEEQPKFMVPAIVKSTNPSEFFIGYNSGGQILAKRIQANANGTVAILATIGGEYASGVSQIDVAVRSDGTLEICYDKNSGFLNDNIYFAVQSGSAFGTPRRVNIPYTGPTGGQTTPAIAISHSYRCNSAQHAPDYYRTISQDRTFDQRRMVVWQSNGQDGSGWGIVGRFYGITTGCDTMAWFSRDAVVGSMAGAIFMGEEKIPDQVPVINPREGGGRGLDETIAKPAAESTLPLHFSLYPPSPNPFNPSTTIRFDLPAASNVEMQVIDLAGRIVATLVDEVRVAGSHSVTFDGTDLSSGSYFVRMQADGFVKVQKMILIK